jgi:uncharacterized membrane protein
MEFHLIDTKMNEYILNIQPDMTPCSDGMSDHIYEYSAAFYYQKETFKGCAEKK